MPGHMQAVPLIQWSNGEVAGYSVKRSVLTQLCLGKDSDIWRKKEP